MTRRECCGARPRGIITILAPPPPPPPASPPTPPPPTKSVVLSAKGIGVRTQQEATSVRVRRVLMDITRIPHVAHKHRKTEIRLALMNLTIICGMVSLLVCGMVSLSFVLSLFLKKKLRTDMAFRIIDRRMLFSSSLLSAYPPPPPLLIPSDSGMRGMSYMRTSSYGVLGTLRISSSCRSIVCVCSKHLF